MKIIIQRVLSASVTIDNNKHCSIGNGILALVGIEQNDTEITVDKALEKIIKYRIFSDTQGKMNLSLSDINGELLLVSQFTLMADTSSGLRPSFSNGAKPEVANRLFNYMIEKSCKLINTKSGVFSADMKVELINDGPVTFTLNF